AGDGRCGAVADRDLSGEAAAPVAQHLELEIAGCRWRVIIADGPGRLAAGQGGPAGVGQRDGKRLVRLDLRITLDGDGNGPGRFPGGEGERAGDRLVVAAGQCGAVSRGEGNGDGNGRGCRQRDGENGVGSTAIPLRDRHVPDGEGRQGGGRRRAVE